MSEETILDKTKNDVRKVVCSRCDTKTNHIVCSSVQLNWNFEEDDIQGSDIYEIIRCSGCDAISFRLSSSNSEDYDIDEEGNFSYSSSEEIFPNRIMGRTALKEIYLLPDKIRSIYKETHAALCTKLKVLAGVGIRALVEAVCSEERAVGDNLEKKIDNLVLKGTLTASNSKVLHKTRILGNRVIHEVLAASDSELDVAFDIVENLLETVYIIPKKAERLK